MVAAPIGVHPSGGLPVRAAIPILPPAPAPVLDHERLAKNILQPFGENPSHSTSVGAAGWIGTMMRSRMIGPTGVFAARASQPPLR